jgi:hypothetical protein
LKHGSFFVKITKYISNIIDNKLAILKKIYHSLLLKEINIFIQINLDKKYITGEIIISEIEIIIISFITFILLKNKLKASQIIKNTDTESA